MSFLTASEDTLICELWPTEMAKEMQKLRGTTALASWQLFPYSLPKMAEWADVYKDEECKDPSRNHILIYKTVPNMAQNTIRKLDWMYTEQYNMSHCLQAVTRKHGMQRLRQLIWCEFRTTKICTYNVRDEPRKTKDPVFKPVDDPEGRFFRIQEFWNPQRPLRVAELTESAKIMPIDSVLLTEGDFVDVGAELDFVLNRDQHSQTILKCFLTCTYIVRMIPASAVQTLNLVRFRSFITIAIDLW
ncbi:hypothetical protein DFH29DRAFT_1069876 [Suillus ampliporus]|nr:hypothetical protein DFH29DRAFT_1069876 [Suillus ampliporus]